MDLSLNSLAQLYNSLDAAPFYDKDLDVNAEHFIVSWVGELPRTAELSLVLHLKDYPADARQRDEAARGIRNYFATRERLTRAELHALLRQGRLSLVIGVGFLAMCLLGSELLAKGAHSLWTQLVSQSLTVAGWVAMWRPLQIYLYDWWPVRRRQLDYRRLGRMPVEVRPSREPR